ncbi:MAG: hypothetical protein ACREJC_19275, partial [Tepidisphaeraceae bacterium]
AGSDYGLHEGVFLPAATLAGKFDASLHPRLNVRLQIGGHGSSIKSAPALNARVMAVISTGNTWADEVVPSDWIVESICLFMPNHSALVVIDGFDDPRVAETLKKIQAARAKPTTQQRHATRPTTKPDD